MMRGGAEDRGMLNAERGVHTMARAALAVLLIGTVAGWAVNAKESRAQQPDAQPPNRFFGTLTLGGQPAPAGTVVTAIVGDQICGSRTTTDTGRYQVDVLSVRERSGCGLSGATVGFRAGQVTAAETGTWAAGQITRLNLTVEGSGSATAAAGNDIAQLDMESPCIPLPNQTACDESRRRLWAADPVSWGVTLRSRGVSQPTPEQIFDEALMMRLDSRDPAAQSALSRLMGWPHIRITALRFRGTAPEPGG
jgi:hypothetical protein